MLGTRILREREPQTTNEILLQLRLRGHHTGKLRKHPTGDLVLHTPTRGKSFKTAKLKIDLLIDTLEVNLIYNPEPEIEKVLLERRIFILEGRGNRQQETVCG
jgi:hypothetical protein